jgi:hypothetical protein
MLIQLMLILEMNPSFPMVYYVSNEGKDSNAGIIQSAPWATIARLNQAKLQPGDSVLFHCGHIFSGQINLKTSGSVEKPIIFSSYGTGVLPVISGSINLEKWEVYGNSIWKTKIGLGRVKQIFENRKRIPPGRFPDEGFFYSDLAGTKNSFKDSELKNSNGKYNGVNIVIRNSDYHWENKTITSCDEIGNVLLSSSVNNNIDYSHGYYLTNHLSFLTGENEWFFNESTGELFLFSISNPEARELTASVFEYGIKGDWNMNNILVSNICFSEQANDGIWLRGAGCANNKVTGCEFYRQRNYGLSVMGKNLTVENNHFEDIGGLGIDIYEADKIFILNNSVKKIGIKEGISNCGVGDLQGMRLWNTKNATITQNVIDSTGYSGLTFNVESGIAEKNMITNTLLVTSDGGAFYCWGKGTKSVTIQKNIVENIVGNLSGRPFSKTIIKHGIYLDNYVSSCFVKDNLIVGAGIITNAGSSNNSFLGNTVYKSPSGITISDWYAGASISGINLYDNVLFVNVVDGCPLVIQSDDNSFNVFTSSNYNRLYNPFGNQVVKYEWSQTNSYSLSEWQSKTGFDNNSRQSPFSWNSGMDESFIIVNTSENSKIYKFKQPVLDIDNKMVSEVNLEPFSWQILVGNNQLQTVNNREIKENKLLMYPNPSSGIINIPNNLQNLRIIDIQGKEVFSAKHPGLSGIDLSFLKTGVYIVLSKSEGILYSDKLVIKK